MVATIELIPSYLGQVATRARIAGAFNAGATRQMSRTRHIARDTITALQLVIPNWYVPGQATAYLVGERGPEVFRPSGSGVIEGGGARAGVTVNVTVDGGAPALLRSEAQIAQALARAAALGARRL